MSPVNIWMRSPMAIAVAKTLLHSFWQAGVAAFILAVLLGFLRSSAVRYAAACCALLIISIAVVVTFAQFKTSADGAARWSGITPFRSLSVDSSGAANGTAASSLRMMRPDDLLPWLTPTWLVGILIFNLRQFISWLLTRRMLHRGVCTAPHSWEHRLNAIRLHMCVSKPVLLMESCFARIPIVLGHARPVILLPVGFLTGLPAEQVELILMHELAHIRRLDYAVNLLQTIIESLMFYNPAVWCISKIIRTEREHCCDDLVVAATRDAHAYASALAALENLRGRHATLAIAATGGSLVKRIRRLLRQRETPVIAAAPAASAALLIVLITLALAARPTAPAPVETPPPQASTAPAIVQLPVLPETPSAPVRQNLTRAAYKPVQTETQRPDAPKRWLEEDAVYIITDEERAAFSSLGTDTERQQFIELFWLLRDPTPLTDENEFRDEHDRRIAFANEHFTSPSAPGWKSDRGQVYIKFGPPDEIRKSTESISATEIWRYRYVETVGSSLTIVFVDLDGSGEFRRFVLPGER